MKILIQAGHQNITNGGTGAPGELEENIRLRDGLSPILISKGFQVFLCDANFIAKEDYDLALSIHGDADIYGTGGGFVDYPDPSVDLSNTESKRIKEAIESEYFNRSGIVNHPERSNANTKFYYWWSMLTAKTPCVIIECGVVQDAHDKVILVDTKRVCEAIARGICKAFGVAFDPVIPPPVVPPTPPNPPMPPVPDCCGELAQVKLKLDLIKSIAFSSKGWWWERLKKIRSLFV